MTGTLAVALYAAAISTVALGWQITSWFLKERTRLRVQAQLLRTANGPSLMLVVTNRSGHRVPLEGIHLIAGGIDLRWLPRGLGNVVRKALVHFRPRPIQARMLVSRSSHINEADGYALHALAEIPDAIEARSSLRVSTGGHAFVSAFEQPERLKIWVSTGEGRSFRARATFAPWAPRSERD